MSDEEIVRKQTTLRLVSASAVTEHPWQNTNEAKSYANFIRPHARSMCTFDSTEALIARLDDRPHYQTAMSRRDFDGASIATQQSTTTIASRVSSIWSKIPSSSRKMILPLHDLCSYLRTTTNMEHSPIEELIIRKEEDGFQHEFLLILLYKPSGGEFWVRLERKRPVGGLSKLLSGALEANDIVSALIGTN